MATTRVLKTLSFDGHTDRVNCVRWVSENVFLSSSVDKSIIVWMRQGECSIKDNYKPISKLQGHSASVTSADAIILANGNLLVVSVSGDSSMKIWCCENVINNFDEVKTSCLQTVQFKGGSFALDVRMTSLPNVMASFHNDAENALIAVSMDSCKVDLYGPQKKDILLSQEDGHFTHVHSLVGHEDWVQCVDVLHHSGVLWIATGGQDNLIRVWKISPVSKEVLLEDQRRVKDLLPDEEIKLTETIFRVGDETKEHDAKYFSVRVETILSGHEDKVFGLQWSISDNA